MQMVEMSGTRFGTSGARRAAIGARGWWSASGTETRWTTQTALAKRYSSATPMGAGTFIALVVIGAGLFGQPGAVLGALVALSGLFLSNPRPRDGFVCLRCGCEFDPTGEWHGQGRSEH